jgi:hypothetical protein
MDFIGNRLKSHTLEHLERLLRSIEDHVTVGAFVDVFVQLLAGSWVKNVFQVVVQLL